VDAVEVQLDGRPSRGIKRVDASATGTRLERLVVSIPAADVQVGIVAKAGTLASEPALVRLKWGAATPGGADLLKPKLYGVIVGVSAYRDPSLRLRYAAKDARDFAAVLQAQKGGLYRDVELKVLTDKEATSAAIKDALEWLNRQVTGRDVAILFLAGHGLTDERNRYFYLAADSDRARLASTAVDALYLREETRALAGKALVFLDTCYAGGAMGTTTRGAVDINSLVNELSSTENGVVTFASSTGRQVSQEDDAWGNGAFTKALIEGMGSGGRPARADLMAKGVITGAQLYAWLAERVKELTRGTQHPVMVLPKTIPDFPMFVAAR
jgi:uncharacterized caspase-like protein